MIGVKLGKRMKRKEYGYTVCHVLFAKNFKTFRKLMQIPAKQRLKKRESE